MKLFISICICNLVNYLFVFLLIVGNDIGLSDAADDYSLFFDFIINTLVNEQAAKNKNEKQKVDNLHINLKHARRKVSGGKQQKYSIKYALTK